jgi:hypothetical protein
MEIHGLTNQGLGCFAPTLHFEKMYYFVEGVLREVRWGNDFSPVG